MLQDPKEDDVQLIYDILIIILIVDLWCSINIEIIKEPKFLDPYVSLKSVVEDGDRICVLLQGEDEDQIQHLEPSRILKESI